MTDEEVAFVPLLQRHGLREARVRERWTSPPELEYIALSQWTSDVLSANLHQLYDWNGDREVGYINNRGIAVARALNIDMPIRYWLYVDRFGDVYVENPPVARIMSIADDDTDLLLDIIDYALSSDFVTAAGVDELHGHLRDGNSAWQVNRDNSGLTLRVSKEEEGQFQEAISVDDMAGRYLTSAWDAARRRNSPSPKEAYDAVVKALEAILAPIVIPNETEPTLGKILGELGAKHNKEKWSTRFRGNETVQALRGLLKEVWKSDSRHAGMPPNSREQAQDAVTIAVAVVALVRRDFLTKADDDDPQAPNNRPTNDSTR